MTGPGPFDNMSGVNFLVELSQGFAVSELELVLDAEAGKDLELSQEQYALATVVAEMVSLPSNSFPAVHDVSRLLYADDTAGALYVPAKNSINRLLNNPFALIFKDQRDGGVAMKREMRALRARLHRACRE